MVDQPCGYISWICGSTLRHGDMLLVLELWNDEMLLILELCVIPSVAQKTAT